MARGKSGQGGKGRGGRGPRRGDRPRDRAPATGKRHGGKTPARPPFPDQLEGRNLVLAGLTVSRRVRTIWIDEGARGSKISALEAAAREQKVPVRRVSRDALDAVAEARIHNGVIGFADGLPSTSLKEVLEDCFEAQRDPLILILDQVQYEQNLGAVLRTACAAGVDAIVVPTRRGASLTPTVQRIAMGGAEEVPVVREGMMSALATLRRAAVRIVGTDAHAEAPYTAADLTGPVAIVMGGEDRGLSSAIAERCDAIVRIPMRPSRAVTSLNVSVSTALLLYERVRQLGQA